MDNLSLIFDVKRYAINDGPGIRVTIFFKGCPLSCQWCHNPEGMSRKRQKMYTESKCIGAQECVDVCEVDALLLTPEGIITDIEKCTLCGDCAEVCPTKAIEMSGEQLSVEGLMTIIKKELPLIKQSEGGVTFSGGEPLHHHKLLIELLDACGEEGIHRCVDTSGMASQKVLLEVAKRTELFLFDLKHTDPVKHEKYTGVTNDKILNNLVALSQSGANIIIRIPLIKDFNDDDNNLKQSAALIASLPKKVQAVNLLPYHNIAENKFQKLGMNGNFERFEEPTKDQQELAINIFDTYGITATIGG